MRWWVRNGKGYSGGDGGQVRITIEEDSAGEPSGTLVRGSQGINFFADLQNDTRQIRKTDLQRMNATLTKGEKYWIVFENVHRNPLKNFFSLNGPLFRPGNRTAGEDIARPLNEDDFFLFEQSGNSWRPYATFGKYTTRTSFPFLVLKVEGVNHGYPFEYGPNHGPIKKLVVDGMNQIRQEFTFSNETLPTPLTSVTLSFFAEKLDRRRGESADVVVLVNKKAQGIVEIGPLGWYHLPLDLDIESDVKYEIEFQAKANANVKIMQGIEGGRIHVRDYDGHATYSDDGGQEWHDAQGVEGVQACFYLSGTPN